MDYNTLLYVWDAFSFILFLVVLLSTLHGKGNFKDNRKLVLTSFMMFVGLFLFYREQFALYEGKEVSLISFFTYAILAIAQGSVVMLIINMYSKVEYKKKYYVFLLIYGLSAGLIMEIDAHFGTFVSKHFLMVAIGFVPQSGLFFYIIIRVKKFYRNIFFYQVLLLIIIYILKTINILLFNGTITFENAPASDAGLLIVANVVLYNYFISFLLVKGIQTNQELTYHKNAIEASLTKAIHLSETDELTKLYNRRKVNKMLFEFEELSKSNSVLFSIILIDVDDFKKINDIYGHTLGDEVLELIASNLQKCLRDSDIIARWGGDEFLVILPNTDETGAVKVVEKIHVFFKDQKIKMLQKPLTLSTGVCDNTNHLSVLQMISIADERMYHNKSNKGEEE